MAHLIDKDALVAWAKETYLCENASMIRKVCYKQLLEHLNTLEVKEVDLDFQRFAKEMDAVFALPSSETKNTEEEPLNWEYAIAKHFFELGMCAANPLTVKDIEKIYHLVNEVSDDLGVRAMYVNIYKETLKRFKAQKGE